MSTANTPKQYYAPLQYYVSLFEIENSKFEDIGISPVTSGKEQLQEFSQAISYPFEIALPQLKRSIINMNSDSYQKRFFYLMDPITIGLQRIGLGLATAVGTIFVTLYLVSENLLKNEDTQDLAKRHGYIVGFFVSHLLNAVASLIGGAIILALSPFIAMAQLIQLARPETFGKAQSPLFSSTECFFEEQSVFEKDIVQPLIDESTYIGNSLKRCGLFATLSSHGDDEIAEINDSDLVY